jgi:hypothetical protein
LGARGERTHEEFQVRSGPATVNARVALEVRCSTEMSVVNIERGRRASQKFVDSVGVEFAEPDDSWSGRVPVLGLGGPFAWRRISWSGDSPS